MPTIAELFTDYAAKRSAAATAEAEQQTALAAIVDAVDAQVASLVEGLPAEASVRVLDRVRSKAAALIAAAEAASETGP